MVWEQVTTIEWIDNTKSLVPHPQSILTAKKSQISQITSTRTPTKEQQIVFKIKNRITAHPTGNLQARKPKQSCLVKSLQTTPVSVVYANSLHWVTSLPMAEEQTQAYSLPLRSSFRPTSLLNHHFLDVLQTESFCTPVASALLHTSAKRAFSPQHQMVIETVKVDYYRWDSGVFPQVLRQTISWIATAFGFGMICWRHLCLFMPLAKRKIIVWRYFFIGLWLRNSLCHLLLILTTHRWINAKNSNFCLSFQLGFFPRMRRQRR